MKQIYYLFIVILFSFSNVEAHISSESQFSDFNQADAIADAKADGFYNAIVIGDDKLANSKIITFLKGNGALSFASQYDGKPLPQDANIYLLFFKSNKEKLEPINNDNYIIGFSQIFPTDTENLKSLGLAKFLSEILSRETSPDCALQQSELLSRSNNRQALIECWETLSKQPYLNGTNPLLNLAAINIGVRATGVTALKDIHGSLSLPNENPHAMDIFEYESRGQLSMWIENNINDKNYPEFLSFAQTQMGSLKSDTLIHLKRYLTLSDAPTIAQMLMSDTDAMVQYACVSDLCAIYGKPIGTIDDFIKDKNKIIEDWKSILISNGALKSK